MNDSWTSKSAFTLAAIGAAVGLGNIWRFPYIASEHGGIWFLVPYIFCLLVIGIPLFLIETGQGFTSKKGFFKSVERSQGLPFVKKNIRKAFGLFPVLVSTVILSYYMVLCSWALWFAVEFILGYGPSFGAMQQSYTTIITFVVVFISAFLVVIKGIHKGIEPVTRYLVPTLFVFLVIILLYSLSLPDTISYLGKALGGGEEKLFDTRTWYFAISQVLFSLSVGYGIMFTYGSHLRGGKGIVYSVFQIAGADTAASILAFLAIVAISATVGTQASGLVLSFEALPAFFANQGLVETAVGALFFALLFGAAFTSVISMIENTKESLSFLSINWKVAIGVGVFSLGILSILSYSPAMLEIFGKPVLYALDFMFGTFLAPFSALVVAFCCAYLLPHQHIARKIGLPRKYWPVFAFIIRRVLPAALLLLILFSQLSGLY